MSTGTMAPYRAPEQTGRDGFAQTLWAEWTKFRTVRGWAIGMVVAILVILGLGLFASGSGGSGCQSSGAPARSGAACQPAVVNGPGGEPVNDSFYFVRQPLAGNGSLTVRVTSLTGQIPDVSANGKFPAGGSGPGMHPGLVPWAKAGIIIKDGTSQGSAYAAMMVTADHGVRMQADYTQDTAGQPGTASPASPRWLRLTRSGDTITGYDSLDGVHWAQVGTVRLAGLPATVQAGLFAASPNYEVVSQNFGGGSTGSSAPSQDTAVFDRLSRSGTWPDGTWTGDFIGGPGQSGAGGYHRDGGRFSVTGSGDIAPQIAGSDLDGVPGGTTIAQHLVGTFAGLIALAVVATMFITAEYRRGLIRTTLAASPRRGRVLAAKAVVIGAAGFVAGLVGALAAVGFGGELAHARDAYVYPVPLPTEVRVIVGTAALAAVVAVLALGLGTVLRRGATAITLVVVAIVLPYILGVASILPVGVSDWLLRLTPAAAFAIQQPMPAYPQVYTSYAPTNGYFPLAPWAGFAVLCGYAAVVLALAAVLLRRRDA